MAGKKILILQQRGWGINIGHYLASQLQNEGCRLASWTFKKTTHEFITKNDSVKYDLILNNDQIMEKPESFLNNDDYSLEEICNSLKISTIWPYVYSLRNHVKSYPYKYYYGFRQNISDENIILYIKAIYKCILIFFNEFKPDLIISPNFVALPHIMMNLYARVHGIRMMGMTDCKVRGINIVTTSFQDNEGPFFDRFRELSEKNLDSPNRDKAKCYMQQFRKEFIQPDYTDSNRNKNKINLLSKIKHEIRPFYHSAKWILNKNANRLSGFTTTIDYKSPKYILRDHYCTRRYCKFMDHFQYYPFKKLQRYAYFPLQFQPEASIDVAAPYYNNQIEAARLVAMSLPDDYTLVVKEHPAMVGFRPPSYIKKIALTPNVKLIDYRIPSDKVIQNSDIIISPNSTSLMEAAFYWKPAIQLGNLGTTLLLPNVFKHTDFTTLSFKIKQLLSIEMKNHQYEKELENYITAAYDAGFNEDYINIWEKGRKENLEKLWLFFKSNINKLIK